MKLLLTLLLTTLSLNAYGFCAWDDHECSERARQQHKMENQLDLQRSEMQRQQIEMDKQQEELESLQRTIDFNSDNESQRWDNSRTAADLIHDWNTKEHKE